MVKRKKRGGRRSRAMLSAYSIIMILILILGVSSHLLPKAQYMPVIPSSDELLMEVNSEIESMDSSAETTVIQAEGAISNEGARMFVKDSESEVITNDGISNKAIITDDANNAEDVTVSENINITVSSPTVDVETNQEIIPVVAFDSREECEEELGVECEIINGSGVVGASLSQILKAPILGFADAIDVCIFIMMLGGLLAVVAKTKALEVGIKIMVEKLKGKEYILICTLMFIFSVLGTTYGFMEESVGFYVLIAATMFAAGLDPLVGVATILLGAGSGVLGSTVNPFATGVAISAMKDSGVAFDQGIILLIATVLWLTTLAISAFFIIRYAKKVQRDKGSTFLSLREQQATEKKYSKFLASNKDVGLKLSGSQIATLIIFGLTFLVMIVGFVPWQDLAQADIDAGKTDSILATIANFFSEYTGGLTGEPLGGWWFYEAAVWFLLSAILISIINRHGEHGFVDEFIDGADDMIGVILVIAVARGASILMGETFLDNYIIYNASDFLATLPEMAFVPLNYILHVFLSVLVPSSSGLATLSTPIIAPVAANLGYSTDVAAMTIVSANGLVNLITPTCGAIMGGLALAKIDYGTWFRWAIKIVGCIAIVNIVILCLFSLI